MTRKDVQTLARLLARFDDDFLPAGYDRIAVQRTMTIVQRVANDPD